MKHLLITLSLCIVAIAAMAQNKADIEVSYTMRSRYQNGAERISKYHLLANTGFSKFFNPRNIVLMFCKTHGKTIKSHE